MNKHDLDIQKILFPSLRFERNYFKIRFPPNRSSEFFFLDIKMCLSVLGSYGMSFVSGLKPGRILPNLLKRSSSEKRKTWSHQHDSKNQNYFWFFSYKKRVIAICKQFPDSKWKIICFISKCLDVLDSSGHNMLKSTKHVMSVYVFIYLVVCQSK